MKRGKSRRKGRTRQQNSKDSRVFFQERIPSAREQSGKQRGRGYATTTIKSRKRKSKVRTRRKEGKVREDVLDAYIDYRVRYQKYRPNPSFPSRTTSKSFGLPSPRGVAESLIFRLFPKKATTLPVCDSEICRRSNLRGHRVGRMRQNCRNDDEFPRGTTGFIEGFEWNLMKTKAGTLFGQMRRSILPWQI